MKMKLDNTSSIFISLNDLLSKEHKIGGLSFLAKKQKVRSILGGKHASKLRGRGLDFEEVRNYVAGDDIRNIDWKVTARTQKTHSRVYSEEKEKPALIIVDQSKSMFFGSQNHLKSYVAAELAAIASFTVLKQGDRVGGVVLADDEIDIVLPKRNRKNILTFFNKIVLRNQKLENTKPIEFDDALKEVYAKIRNIVTHDFLIIIISDFMRYSEKTIKNISYLGQHNDVILAKIFDPLEHEIPSEKIIAGDGTKQLVIDGKNKKVVQNFADGFHNDFSEFERIMKKHRIPVLKFDTIIPIEEQLKSIFSKTQK